MGDRDFAATHTQGQSALARTGLALLVAAALAVATLIGSAGQADAAIECRFDAVTRRLVCKDWGTPLPTTTTSTTPPPLLSLPPITIPPLNLPPITIPPILAPPAAPRVVPEAATRLLELVNGERAKAGLGALAMRDDVVAVALEHTQKMAAAGNIFHSDSFFGATIKNLLNVVVRGENVAYNASIDNAHVRLMNSAGHRANILDGRFSVAGFAVMQVPDGRYFITQNFIQPAGAPRSAAPRAAAPAAPRPAPAPKPKPAPAPAPAPTTTTTTATTVAPAPAPVPVAVPESAVLSASSPPAPAVTPETPPTTVPAALALILLVIAGGACCWIPLRRFI